MRSEKKDKMIFNSKYSVIGPTGAFANQVRWLILLDRQFTINLPNFNLEKYNELKGPDWPSYNDYVVKNLLNVPDFIKEEFDELGAYQLKFDTLDNKLKAFKYQIYPESRTWHNWLQIEHHFRDSMNNVVNVLHDLKHSEFNIIEPDAKNLFLTIDPELAYRCYLKFNSNLNNLTPEYFKKIDVEGEFDLWQEMVNNAPKHNKILNVNILYQPELDRNFYNELIQWFELDNNYEHASYVHQLWYKAHRRAEKEFVTDIHQFYKGTN